MSQQDEVRTTDIPWGEAQWRAKAVSWQERALDAEARLAQAEAALAWYDAHKRDDGSYDGETWGDLRRVSA